MRKKIYLFFSVVCALSILVLFQLNGQIALDNKFAHLHKDRLDTNASVLCILLSSAKSIDSRASVAWNTWAHRCNRTLFACNCQSTLNTTYDEHMQTIDKLFNSNGNLTNQRLPILKLDGFQEDYNRMGEKCLRTLRTAYELYASEHNWFLLADDDTFVFVDNLFRFVRARDSGRPLTYGYNFRTIIDQGYHSGGAGILFTLESLRRIYHKIVGGQCKVQDTYGDLAIGRCAEAADVQMGQSVDAKGRERFHCLAPGDHYFGNLPDWIFPYSSNPVKVADNCCR